MNNIVKKGIRSLSDIMKDICIETVKAEDYMIFHKKGEGNETSYIFSGNWISL